MAVTAYKSPGTTANVDRAGQTDWTNTDNAKVSDDNWAQNLLDKDADFCDWLRLTNFSMGVPAGATIDGIEVQIERHIAGGTATYDESIYLRKTSGQVGGNYADGDAWANQNDTTVTYGGATDLWVTTWSEGDVNSSDFGIDISVLITGADNYARVDHVQIRVHYTEEAPTGTNISINIADTFKDVDSMQINIGDVWKDVVEVQQNIGDVWKTVF